MMSERNIHEMLKEASPEEGRKPGTLPISAATSASITPHSQSSYDGHPSTGSAIWSPDDGATSPNGKIPASSRIDTLKNWSISTYKCTKQLMYEKLGKSSRTIDLELESQIENLRDTQRKYLHILKLSRALTSHFYHVVQTQHALGESFADLAQKSPELQEEFLYNAETQRNLTKNGETLISALNFFVSTLNTLCNKTIEDTIITIRQYEQARVEYDAYRSDVDVLAQTARSDGGAARLEDAQVAFQQHKQHFDKLKGDVAIKMQFLDDNRIKVMHKQLLLFHNAVAAYFSGNQQALEATIKQFNIRVRSPNSTTPSWLEQ